MPRKKAGRQPRYGTIDVLPSGRWRGRYRANGVLTNLGTFETWEDAEEALAKVQARFTLGLEKEPTRKGQNGLEVVIDQYFKTRGKKLSERTRTENLASLNNHVVSYFKGIPLNQIDRWKIEVWWHSPNMEKRPVARRNTYFALRSVMNYAVARGYIAENPCQVEDAGATVAKDRPYMSPADFDRIIAQAPQPARMIFEFMLGSHARLGEVVALTVADVSLELGTVALVRQIRKDGEAPAENKHGSKRTVTVFPSSFAPVKVMLASRIGTKPSDALFLREDGSPVTRTFVQYHWRKAREKAGLPQFHVHDIRHTGLTIAEGTGQGIKNVQLRAGHSTTSAALRYQHARLEADSGMADAADAALRLARGQLVAKPAKAKKKKR